MLRSFCLLVFYAKAQVIATKPTNVNADDTWFHGIVYLDSQ